jgi:hypothetical protein
MVRINIPTSYGTLPESSAAPISGSKTRRIHMFLALASVALCLVVVASVANSSKRLSGTVELFDASAESGQFPCSFALLSSDCIDFLMFAQRNSCPQSF